MSEPARARCDDCGYWIASHVSADGRFIGCPVRIAALDAADALPRITVRVGKVGARKGRVFVAWPDHLDADSNQIIVWDMGTGDRFVDDQTLLQRGTRRATRDQEYDVQAEVEYQLGGKVRVIGGNWGRATAVAQR
jgi:hypothetical protein